MLPIERLQKSNTIENLWIYILAFLKKRKIYAWEIPAVIERELGFKPGKITPYRVLYRLEKDGFVKSKTKERRRVYEITEKGEKEFKKARKFYQVIIKWLEN
ncbi:MAG TPA: helix-turn-helix transcriptional regulator [Candidatus Humimicrobiaceae bacterium]|nr:helix-turn-helix transcriptional regulator [Candidatus Humimicrobiaceae bacterium]